MVFKKKATRFIACTLGKTTRQLNRLRILTYHSIQNHQLTNLHLNPYVFEGHIKYLATHRYKTVTISEIVSNWPQIVYEPLTVALTFDDGLLNNYTIACQILSQYNFTGTFFIPTAYVGESNKLPVGEGMKSYHGIPMLSWDNLKQMVDLNFEIGAHSHSHVMVARQEYKRAVEEIFTPKKILENKLGVKINSFAYPKGHSNSFSKVTKQLVTDAGYKAACTQVGGPVSAGNDLMVLPRQGMTGFDDLEIFKLKLYGNYDCLKWFRLRQ